jgi:RNA recognition motif-containing protein
MEEDNPAVVEDGQGDGVSPKKVCYRKRQLYKTIRKQMEFYFSDANLTKDRFLGNLIREDPYIDLSIFLRFNKIRALTTDAQDIADALRNSELLSLTEDGTKVLRTAPIKEKDNIDDCTIYVEQLPPDAQHDWLREVFSAYGKVAYVSVPKYRATGKIKGFAFVEFDTPEEANKTIEEFGARGCLLSPALPPENLCSISTYEHDEMKSENIPSEYDLRDASEEINKNEDSQSEDKLSRKKKKKKRGKQEHGADFNIEDSEVADTKCKKRRTEEAEGEQVEIELETGNSQREDDNTPPKKKKRRKTEMSGETEMETGYSQAEDDSTPPKKQKKKKTEVSSVEGMEGRRDIAHQSDETETCLEKKKRKRKTVDMEETDVAELPQLASDVHENEEVGKKKKTKSLEWDERVFDKLGSEVEAAEKGAEVVVKKKTRKRQKKHKKEIQEASQLRILSKQEWKHLRNKYLNVQKKKMQCLKQFLSRNRFNRNSQFHRKDQLQHANGQNQEEQVVHGDGGSEEKTSVEQQGKDQPRFTFIRGVIVHAVPDEPIVDVQKFKSDIKAHHVVEYVDVMTGANEVFLRCSTPAAAEELVSSVPWKLVEILKGEDESQYWNKMLSDRAQKIRNNIRVKQRGRDKILKTAERELGKHTRFDD